MHLATKLLIGSVAGAGLMAGTAFTAAADIACSGNVCWHVHDRYHYPRGVHVVVHPDSWHMSKRYVIREHEGRGYWRGNSWHAW
jgi:hypothetical protein